MLPVLGDAVAPAAADPGTALEPNLGASAATSPRSHPLPVADLRSPNLSPPASPGRAEQAGAARAEQGVSPALHAGSEQGAPGAARVSTIAGVLERLEARKGAAAGACQALDPAPGSSQAAAGQGQRRLPASLGGKGERAGGCAGGSGAARRPAVGPVPLHADMRPGVLRLVWLRKVQTLMMTTGLPVAMVPCTACAGVS